MSVEIGLQFAMAPRATCLALKESVSLSAVSLVVDDNNNKKKKTKKLYIIITHKKKKKKAKKKTTKNQLATMSKKQSLRRPD